jgi:glycosyltransferase involved in cell wall biosynthesis
MILYHSNPSACPPLFHAALSFAERGVQVETVCLSPLPDYPMLETIAEGYRIRRFYFRSQVFFHRRFGLSPSNKFVAILQYICSYTEFILRSALIAWKTQADVYEAHDLPALLPTYIVSLLRRKPLVYHAHELYPEMIGKMRFARLWRMLEKILVPRADLVVTPEENRSRIYYDEYHSKRMPLTILNCPPYVPPRKSTKLRDELAARGIPCDTIVLYQGLMDTSRCIQELAESAKYFNDGTVLVLLGDGFKGWENPSAVFGSSDRIVHYRRVEYQELLAYTSSADIGVLFYRNECRNNYFCAPNKLYEYMMMGLPVITNNFPGMMKIVEGENVGLCVDPTDPPAVAGAIGKLTTNRALYEAMRENCFRLTREKYNWQEEFKKLYEGYQTFLNGNGSAAGHRTTVSDSGRFLVGARSVENPIPMERASDES